jgi:predicted Zn-dependent peptidase
MFFKGTEKRNWKQINSEFAKLGVSNNAYTSNNEVFYHTTCPKTNIEGVIDLMLDMFFNSTIPEEELEKERGVIAEEKKMYDDDHRDAFQTAIGNNLIVWDKGHAVIGTFETIESIKREQFVKFLEEKTNLGNLIFVCSGNVPTEKLKEYISKRVPKEHPFITPGSRNEVSLDLWSDEVNKPDKIKLVFERDNITQTNISMLSRGLSIEDDCFNDSVVLYKAIGGGMYSKLFTRIREELGLCYATGMYSHGIAYPHVVISDLYGYIDPKNIDLFMEESEKILDDIIKNGLDEDIFECAKIDYLATVMRQTENSFGKAQYMVKRYLAGKQDSVDDRIKVASKVKRETCNLLAEQLLTERNWAVMIPKGN